MPSGLVQHPGMRSSAKLILLTAVLPLACASEAPIGKQVQAINQGKDDVDEIFRGVGGLHTPGSVKNGVPVSGGFCTGVLISPALVLTASHCMMPEDSDADRSKVNLLVSFRNTFCTDAAPTACSGACTNTDQDNNNCGACGTVCPAGKSCVAGSCADPATCAGTGRVMCGTTCTSLRSDNANCGACGKACASGSSCDIFSCVANTTAKRPIGTSTRSFSRAAVRAGRSPSGGTRTYSAQDIAVVELDTIIPSVSWVRLPALDGCAAAANRAELSGGTIVGYSTETELPPDTSTDEQTWFRRWNFARGSIRGCGSGDKKALVVSGACSIHEESTFQNDWNPFDYGGVNKGDSGGPLFGADINMVCGVASWFGPGIGGDDLGMRNVWAAVDSQSNLAWIDGFRNVYGDLPGFCKGKSGPDKDGDRIPDACDNCPSQYNPDQADSNGNGIGDVCDLCPFTAGTGADSDGDGVGDLCDNCSLVANGRVACVSDFDCTTFGLSGATKKGICMGALPSGSPATATAYRRCQDTGGTPSVACVSDADCKYPGSYCGGPAVYGRCLAQTDDKDLDGIGDKCDACPRSPIRANSNADSESKEFLSDGSSPDVLSDGCDPVPQYVSKVIVADGDTASYNAYEAALMVASKGIGVPPTDVPVSVTSDVGFRYCSCIDELGVELSPALCKERLCSGLDSRFNVPSEWTKVTVGSTLDVANLKALPPRAPRGSVFSGRRFQYTLSSFIGEGTDEPSFFLGDIYRVGTLETVAWYYADDLDLIPYKTMPDLSKRTVGLFWSHVLPLPLIAGRDIASGGRLRNHFEYIVTPTKTPILKKKPFAPCSGPGCGGKYPSVRVDLVAAGIPPIYTPGDTDPVPGLLSRLRGPTRLVFVGGEWIAEALGGNDMRVVSDAIGSGLGTILSDAARTWLAPVDGDQLPPQNAIMVGLPAELDDSSQPLAVFAAGGQLVPAIQTPTPPGNLAAAGAVSDIATDYPSKPPQMARRLNALGVYSGREGVVYVAGGASAVGELAGDIWSYNTSARRWAPVLRKAVASLGSSSPKDRPIGKVVALGYDANSRSLVFVDEFKEGVVTWRRISVVRPGADRRTLTVVPRVGLFSDLELGVLEDGTWALVARNSLAPGSWTAFRFGLEPDRWLGLAAGKGSLDGRPFTTRRGLMVPLRDGSGLAAATTLRPADFKGTTPCTGL